MHAVEQIATREAMQDLGERLAALLRAGDVVVLDGDLGAGKTTLTQGIGAGLGVRGPVTSPTFVIARVHPSLVGGPALVHVDAYRLGSIVEVDDLDLDASLDEAVTVVEWGEGMVEELASDRLQVRVERPRGGNASTDVTVGPDGDVDEEPVDEGLVGEDEGSTDVDEPRRVVLEGVGPRWADVELGTRGI